MQYFICVTYPVSHGRYSAPLLIPLITMTFALFQEAMQVDEFDRPELEWWKCKKWALHILERFIYRYGNPANAEKEYSQFAQYYSKTFNGGLF